MTARSEEAAYLVLWSKGPTAEHIRDNPDGRVQDNIVRFGNGVEVIHPLGCRQPFALTLED